MNKENGFDWIVTAIGLGFLAIGVISFVAEFVGDQDRTAQARGTVVGEKIKFTGEYNVMLPVVSFLTSHGQPIQFTSNSTGPGPGKSVTVRYDPTRPSDAKIDTHGTSLRPFIFMVVGGFLVFNGIRKHKSRNTGVHTPDGNQIEISG